MALTAPWRDCTCRLLGREEQTARRAWALSGSGFTGLIDLSGLACEYWTSSPVCRACQLQGRPNLRFSEGISVSPEGCGPRSLGWRSSGLQTPFLPTSLAPSQFPILHFQAPVFLFIHPSVSPSLLLATGRVCLHQFIHHMDWLAFGS